MNTYIDIFIYIYVFTYNVNAECHLKTYKMLDVTRQLKGTGLDNPRLANVSILPYAFRIVLAAVVQRVSKSEGTQTFFRRVN